MIRALIRLILNLAGNALGLLLAALLLDKMEINGVAFVVAIVIFSLTSAVAQWSIMKMAQEDAKLLQSSSALITTFVALVITAAISDGLSISGFDTWIFATLIIWLVTLLAGIILPLIFLKNRAEDRA